MSGISTHVLDVSIGQPAAEIQVALERSIDGDWQPIAFKPTDADGRCKELLSEEKVVAGSYRLVFDTGSYFFRTARATLYPEVYIAFTVADDGASYHIPLLLSPFGYSTYRGS